ncbi:hypothetical protein [Brevibacillus choshinensis]|uniref:Mannosyltransferase n=1 Tax=Brevibacillus choshinensis TaxID=54911 RepID=A0ABX7FW94_BRECH|nr:hypothetical protein [Brevibacillus choshinensis]QRG69340.1 hypothetical protein JNE38_09530 [Brevibacillus choshinensis]
MGLPVIFIHRADEEHLGFCMQQAIASNPKSRVILIGNPENKKRAPEETEHHLISDYYQSAMVFSTHYRHLSPNDYVYNLFCFQRWFILRDFMRANKLQAVLYLDSDVMLHTDINAPEFKHFTLEYSWTTFCDLPTMERYCAYLISYFREPHLLQKVLDFCREIGDAPLSDMVTCIHFHNYFLRRNSTYGVIGDSFFDHNLSCPLAPPCPQIESLNGKKKIYLKEGKLLCKFTEKEGFLKVNSLHFQGATKQYISSFLSAKLPSQGDLSYFDYATYQWVCAPS